MKQYNITVNGTTYQVEVEEVGGASAPSAPRVQAAPAAAAPKAAPAPVAAPAPKAAPAAPVAAGGEVVVAPMPGTIFDIPVVVGQAVKAGENLIILEAMKMENEIVAPADGTVKTIHVTKGTSVSSGDALITLG